MYHCKVNICLFGLDTATINALKKIPPLERFEHNFTDKIEFIEDKTSDFNVIIFDAAKENIVHAIPEAIGKNGIYIICTDTPDKLSETTLEFVDDIWAGVQNLSLVTFYFQRLLKQLKEKKDFWLCRNYLDATIDTLPDMVWYKDKKGAHLKVNNAFCEVVGKTREDVQGRGHYYIWGLTKEQYEHGEFVCMETEEEVMQKRCTCVFDEQVLGKNGMRQLVTYKSPLFEQDGTLMGTLGIARDVTVEHQYQQRIIEMAHTDELTGLANRRFFYQYMAEHQKDNRATAFYLDIDHFKNVNDMYGHEVGDRAIKTVANALKISFPEGFIVRLGGDEFFVVFIRHCSLEEISKWFELLLRILKESFRATRLTLSMGVAFSKGSHVSIDELMRESDAALYEAKRRGKSKYCIFVESEGDSC